MKSLTFNNITEFVDYVEQSIHNEDFLNYVKQFKTFDSLLKKCPTKFRVLLIANGCVQFVKNCNWSELTDNQWNYLINKNESFKKYK